MTSIKIIAHNLIFIYWLCIALLLLAAQQAGCAPRSLPMGPSGQSTCGNLKWSRGQIVAPAETLNRLGSYKEPHTDIIVRESPCGKLGALVRRVQVKGVYSDFPSCVCKMTNKQLLECPFSEQSLDWIRDTCRVIVK